MHESWDSRIVPIIRLITTCSRRSSPVICLLRKPDSRRERVSHLYSQFAMLSRFSPYFYFPLVAEDSQASSPGNRNSPEPLQLSHPPPPNPVNVPESTASKDRQDRRPSQADAQQYASHLTLSPNEMGPPSTGSDRIEIGEHQVLVPKAGMTGRPIGIGGRMEGTLTSRLFESSPLGKSDLIRNKDSIRYKGPTSLSYILHSTASLPRHSVEEYDLRNHQTWQFTTDDGDGVIRVCNPPTSSSFRQNSGYTESSPSEPGQPPKPILTAALISTLVNSYFTHIAPLFPIVCKKQFVKGGNPPPLLLYAMAGAASTRRGVKKEVFNAIRGVINGLIRNNDVLSDPSLTNVQALVSFLPCDSSNQSIDWASNLSHHAAGIEHGSRYPRSANHHRHRSLSHPDICCDSDGSKFRATQGERRDLERSGGDGEDRVEATGVGCLRDIRSMVSTPYVPSAIPGSRLTAYQFCRVAACLGLPMLIDITDCDCLLPSPYEITSNADGTTAWHITEHQPYAILTEHLKLSILLGRVLKCVYR